MTELYEEIIVNEGIKAAAIADCHLNAECRDVIDTKPVFMVRAPQLLLSESKIHE